MCVYYTFLNQNWILTVENSLMCCFYTYNTSISKFYTGINYFYSQKKVWFFKKLILKKYKEWRNKLSPQWNKRLNPNVGYYTRWIIRLLYKSSEEKRLHRESLKKLKKHNTKISIWPLFRSCFKQTHCKKLSFRQCSKSEYQLAIRWY